MNILIPIVYAIIWFLVYCLLGFSKSKYLNTNSQKNNFVVVLHAFWVPLLCFIYFLTLPEPFGYEHRIDEPIKHLIFLSVGYYIYATIFLLLFDEKSEKAMLYHHLLVGACLLYLALTPEFPAYYAFILVPQGTAVFYHMYLIFKETPGASTARIDFWYNCNFYAWIILRFLIQGIYTLGAFYYEFTYAKLPQQVLIGTIIGLSVSWYFNLHWLVILLRKRKGQRQEK